MQARSLKRIQAQPLSLNHLVGVFKQTLMARRAHAANPHLPAEWHAPMGSRFLTLLANGAFYVVQNKS